MFARGCAIRIPLKLLNIINWRAGEERFCTHKFVDINNLIPISPSAALSPPLPPSLPQEFVIIEGRTRVFKEYTHIYVILCNNYVKDVPFKSYLGSSGFRDMILAHHEHKSPFCSIYSRTLSKIAKPQKVRLPVPPSIQKPALSSL